MANDLKLLGDNIASVRKMRGWTQKKLADEAGLTQGMISIYESGKTDDVGLTSIKAMARAMNVTAASLMGDVAISLEVITREPSDEERLVDLVHRFNDLNPKRKAICLLALTTPPEILDIIHDTSLEPYLNAVVSGAADHKKPIVG